VGEQVLVIEARFCGPPDSGNGGYVCGLLGAVLGGPGEITLRQPPPIGRPLLRRATDRGLALFDGDQLVAEGVPARLELDVPDPVHPAAAMEAAQRYPGFDLHPYPTCFVCGPQRDEGDGLRIFPGPVTDRDVVAAPWTPGRTLANGESVVRPEFVWAALDCPGAFANGFPEIPMVLGRLTVELIRPVRAGQPLVVLGWSEGSERRKLFAGTALLGQDGELVAQARATWISLAPAEPLV
jgi:hypothetical protein